MSAHNPLSLPESFYVIEPSKDGVISVQSEFVYGSTLPPELANLQIVGEFPPTPPEAGIQHFTC